MVPPESLYSVSAVSALLQKRVLFLVGKGGVGKTTIASALALAVSRLHKKTLLIEFEENTRAARLLGLPPLDKPTDILRQVSPTLFVLSISGAAALEEYLHLIIPVKRLVRTVVESRLYQYFVAAAPGLKELLTMGKVWYEERRRDVDTQRLRWDMLIVDMPATGHSLQYLRMPYAARDAFGEGLVHREAERIAGWLSAPDKTAINLVSTLEELPVSETLAAYQQLTEDLRLPLGVLFVNRLHQAPVSQSVVERIRIDAKGSSLDRRLAAQILAYARTEAMLAEMHTAALPQLQRLQLPQILVPFYFAEEFGLAQVKQLSLLIEAFLVKRRKEKSENGRRRKGEQTVLSRRI